MNFRKAYSRNFKIADIQLNNVRKSTLPHSDKELVDAKYRCRKRLISLARCQLSCLLGEVNLMKLKQTSAGCH